MRLSLAILAAPLLFAGCMSMAAPSPAGPSPQDIIGEDFSRTGLYAGLYAIQSKEVFDTPSGVSAGDSDLGAGLKLGFRIIDRIAIEAVAENVDGFNVEQGNVDADLELIQYGVNGKFFLLKGRVQPYGLLGLGIASSDVRGFDLEDDGAYVRLGIGVDIYLTGNFAAFGEVNYNKMTGATSDLDHIDGQIGVLFRF